MNADGSETEPSLDVPTAVLLSEGPCWGGKVEGTQPASALGTPPCARHAFIFSFALGGSRSPSHAHAPRVPGGGRGSSGAAPCQAGEGREGKKGTGKGREGKGGSDRCCEDGDGGRGASALLPAALLPLPQVHPHRLLHRLLGEPGVPGCQACVLLLLPRMRWRSKASALIRRRKGVIPPPSFGGSRAAKLMQVVR